MSNKPFRIRQKGAMLQSQPRATPSRDSPLKRLPSRLRGLLTRKALAQAGLVAALLALCTVYTAGLNDNAAAVVAAKRELPIYSVEHDDKVISISFDASWGADKTLSLLDILDEHNVKTTFFLVGGWVDKYPDMVQAIVARGHEIGNHSNTHPHMNALGEQAIRDVRIWSN